MILFLPLKQQPGVTLSLWCGNYNTVHNDLIALADEVHQLDWKYFPRFVPEEVGKASKKKTESKDKEKTNSNQNKKPNQRTQKARPKQNKNTNRNSNKNSDSKNSEKKSNHQRRRPYKNRDKIPRVKKDEGSSWTDKFLKITNWSDKS